jgi:hypothetical protein
LLQANLLIDAFKISKSVVSQVVGQSALIPIKLVIDGATAAGIPPKVVITQGGVSSPAKVPKTNVNLVISPSAASM